MRKNMLLAAGFFVTAAIGSTILLMQELGPFSTRDASQPGALNHPRSQESLEYGYSSYSKKLVLDDCFIGMQMLVFNGAPSETIVAFDKKCENIASEIVATTPSNSYAWWVKAFAHAALGEEKQFNESIRQSQLTGPNEQWVADLRVRFSEENLGLLDDDTKRTHEKDLALLAGSTRGAQTIAAQYVKNPNFRERIIKIVEKLPAAKQQNFLSRVRIAKVQG